MHDCHPIRYTAMVNKYSNRHARYKQSEQTRTWRDLTGRLNVSRCIPFSVWYCNHSHSSQLCRKPCLPPSLVQTPVRSLQIHRDHVLQNGIRDRGSCKCSRRRCLHLNQWSLAVTDYIHFGKPDMTRRIFATGRLLKLYVCNRRPFMSASDLETVSHVMR